MGRTVTFGLFEWDEDKEAFNVDKYGIDFTQAAKAFTDHDRLIVKDEKHSKLEDRLFCIGKVEGKILTVRYTKRSGRLRIIGAGSWRKESKLYEEKTKTKK